MKTISLSDVDVSILMYALRAFDVKNKSNIIHKKNPQNVTASAPTYSLKYSFIIGFRGRKTSRCHIYYRLIARLFIRIEIDKFAYSNQKKFR